MLGAFLLLTWVAVLFAANYWAAMCFPTWAAWLTLTASSAPPIAAIGYSGYFLAFDLMAPEEAMRRVQAGAHGYFMADFGFAICLTAGLAWLVVCISGYGAGRQRRAKQAYL